MYKISRAVQTLITHLSQEEGSVSAEAKLASRLCYYKTECGVFLTSHSHTHTASKLCSKKPCCPCLAERASPKRTV